MVRITSFLLPFLAVCILSVALLAGLAEAADYVACRAESISVDGVLDEPDWGRASWSPRFSDLVTGAPGWFDTRAAILWDLENLYVAFRVEEHDVRAFLTVRDSPIYRDNDVELFIDGGDAYYELEINPFGTIYEVFWIWDDARDTPFLSGPSSRLMASASSSLMVSVRTSTPGVCVRAISIGTCPACVGGCRWTEA